MRKSAEAFRTISEVATWLDTPAHVLRFWESRFPEISPVKRAGGRRYYRPEDMRLLGGIKHLLHTEGHTIKSVQERLQLEGSVAIAAFSPPLNMAASAGAEAPDSETSEGRRRINFTAPQSDDQPTLFDAGSAASEDAADTPDEDVPPIGFFFDDSDDAVPAEDQSGTFAGFDQPEEPAAPEDTAADESPLTFTRSVTEPAQAIEIPDLVDIPALPGVSHMLRGLVPGQLTAEHQAQIRTAASRLESLRGAAR